MAKKKTLEQKITDNIKGAIGETVIKELFIANDFVVYDYGVEHLVPSFSPRVGPAVFDEGCETSKVVRSLPDFLVVKDGKAHYVEVKFVSKDFYHDLDNNYAFRRGYIINVKKNALYIAESGKISDGELAYRKMINVNPFKLKKSTIEDAQKAVSKYFI